MKRTSPVLIGGLLVGLLFTGCATKYQRQSALSLTGGFKELDLGRDIYRVQFAGNGYTTHETAQTLWLYRCTELALEKGFDGFEILSPLRLSKPSLRQDQMEPSSTALQPAQYVVVVPQQRIEKPTIEADIRLLKPPFFPEAPRTFNVRELKAALEPYAVPAIQSRKNVKPHAHDYIYPPRTLPRPL